MALLFLTFKDRKLKGEEPQLSTRFLEQIFELKKPKSEGISDGLLN